MAQGGKSTTNHPGRSRASDRTDDRPKAKPVPATRAATATTPLQTKQALRERIEKLERSNVNLRIKNRATAEALRVSAERLDAFEQELETLRAKASPTAARGSAPRRRAERPAPVGHDHRDPGPPARRKSGTSPTNGR